MRKNILIVLLAVTTLFIISCAEKGPSGPAGTGFATVVFQQGILPSDSYSGCSDTIIAGADPTLNFGAWDEFLFGLDPSDPYRCLVKFDISSIIPQNVTVSKASLTLTYEGHNGSNTVTAFALTRAFTEGTEVGGSAGTGACWNTYDGTNNWSTAGGDYNAAAMSNSIWAGAGTTGVTTLTLDLNTAMVQNWITNPSQNYGIILIGSNETSLVPDWVRYYSKEAATAHMRPALTIKYKLP